jgi:hypothetical protein
MRTPILSVLALFLAGFQAAFGQLQRVTLTVNESGTVEPKTISVPDGKVFELVYFNNNDTSGSPVGPTFTIDGRPLRIGSTTLTGLMLPGPATFTVSLNQGSNPPATYSAILVYRFTDNTSDGAQQSPFSGSAVVIPEDASGPVEIILESSTDLVNWTAANPGTYGSSTVKRFFRVRAVIQSGNPAP